MHAVYDALPTVLADLGLTSVQGILFDLGVSSLQLDEADRGFAYAQDAPLDMRMDPTRGITAAEVVNTYDGKALARVLREYGDERFASRIADAIVRERASAPLSRPPGSPSWCATPIPAATRRTGGHPAKRTFQALRIEVNDELGVLRRAIPAALDALAVGGRVVVMSYQSLEDKIVKAELVRRATSDVPVDLPFVPEGSQPELRLLVRGSEQAADAEVTANPRAQSVRLRAAERQRTRHDRAPDVRGPPALCRPPAVRRPGWSHAGWSHAGWDGRCSDGWGSDGWGERAPAGGPGGPAPRPPPQRPPRAGRPAAGAAARRTAAAGALRAASSSSLLVGGLLGLLLLNTLVAQGSFARARPQHQNAGPGAAGAGPGQPGRGPRRPRPRSPPRPRGSAWSPGGPPAFLRLSDGKVLGKPDAGAAPASRARRSRPRPCESSRHAGPAAASRSTTDRPKQQPASRPRRHDRERRQ